MTGHSGPVQIILKIGFSFAREAIMRWALLFCGLLLLVGCTRTASPGSQPSPAVLPITNPAPPTAAAPPSRPSIEDQPFRTPTFDQKYDWKLEPGELKFLETNRRTKHQLTLVLKATPVGSKVGVVVVDKTEIGRAHV